ncbi:hypothetical protein Goklo_024874 [Gossypium klotzschianum]|uniref:RNase H type-1 domain-containing protein n=1 Tax=Gossypium klotzschianum TaxID=34286 RepID=A0A7J8W7F0_9ROSI|nr:hypothetical protein [Gossypium klotzschianum]
MTTLWNNWNNRNNFIFKGKEEEAWVIWDRARTISQEFCICNLINEPLLSSNPVVQKWENPPKGFVKINFDASVYNNKVNYGVIARDEDGFVLGGGRGLNERPILMEEAKCYTFKESIKLPYLDGSKKDETKDGNMLTKVSKQKLKDSLVIDGWNFSKAKIEPTI